MKIFTAMALAPGQLARAVGQNHHVGQVDVYVSAPNKAAGYERLQLLGLTPTSKASFKQATSVAGRALVDAGIFGELTIVVTHRNFVGPVVRIGNAGAEVIGKLTSTDGGYTLAELDPGALFRATFALKAAQLAQADFAAQWHAMSETDPSITAEDAAGWANLGFTPGEAAAEMARGRTLSEVRDAEERRANHGERASHIWRNGKIVI